MLNVACEHDVPAPDEVFSPEPIVDGSEELEQDDMTVRNRTIAKTREIWKAVKAGITNNSLPHKKNTETHENAFWEGRTFIGSDKGTYAESGTWNFAAKTTRDRVQRPRVPVLQLPVCLYTLQCVAINGCAREVGVRRYSRVCW